jgi:hypothetical protein
MRITVVLSLLPAGTARRSAKTYIARVHSPAHTEAIRARHLRMSQTRRGKILTAAVQAIPIQTVHPDRTIR